MTSSYAPPPQRITPSDTSLASTSYNSPNTTTPDEELTILDLQTSVYVFPNPPSSPGGSSLFSVSSDFTGPFPGSLSTASRGRDHSRSITSDSRASQEQSPAPSIEVESQEDENSAGWRFVTQTQSTAARSRSPDVEVWNWSADSTEDMDDHRVWELEREVERAGRWDPSYPRRRPLESVSSARPFTFPTISNAFPTRFIRTFDIRNQNQNRIRTQSNISTGSTWASLSTRASVQTPHPRIHIPLLSYIASLFALDLDDPALRLLTNSTSDSVLFPGQNSLLDSSDPSEDDSTETIDDDDADGSESTNDESTTSKEHGVLRLFAFTDESKVALRSVREGLGVVCNPSFNGAIPASPFTLPSIGGVSGLYRLVGDVWAKGGQALRQLRTSPEFEGIP
ncbi:hypothetical protein NLI96_g1282 [Meripilus lineatus]|uniref:Uncharacterized protein n=1 Tax=Meripilus lineatus TaxID=2056292 RepID=A0AAD5VGA2_9APHY|nr:hypothetical protein NLI96_g1282 [Physisporinus lineatus]